MSSFANSYNVVPNSTVDTTPYIPARTQLNGAGPLVDLIPQIIYSVGVPSYQALSNTSGTTNILFTDILFQDVGTYMVTVNYGFITTGAPWQNSETMILDVCTTDTENVIAIPNVTLQPNYFSNFVSDDDEIDIGLTGLVELTGPAFLNARVTRYGSLSANKRGGLYSMTIQKIA